MAIEIPLPLTVVFAILVLLVGRWLIGRIDFLARYSIPDPVVGGLIVAVVLTLVRVGTGTELSFDMGLQSPLLLIFFSTVGLGADVRTLTQGGRKLLLLLAAVVVALVLQNVVGVAIALGLDLNPLMGILGGSATLAGGHGTGAAYGQVFGEVNGLQGAVEVAMACATFGLILGGVLGGPVAQWLIRRHHLQPEAQSVASLGPGEVPKDERRALSPESLIETILILMLCLGVGALLAERLTIPGITLPTFVWCLLVGIILRNALSLSGLYRIDGPTIELMGTVSLSLFLAMALMSLRLWELVNLALPILIILVAQALLTVLLVVFLTFRVMGRNYDAAVIAAGQCGFQLGATPTAIANMQAVTSRHGLSPMAFLLVPIIGAFLIDICNALVIQGFLALPWFGF
ncbi:sodium/glutamate symporter [Thiorhodovibrio frisius]|uniref:Sodium/glutamate symporter n=1 Tax=Thiorhodovibrio frisius TaxID=631362 RepID=H8Z390_9GAMM|nr:sodium/glutamate symporter [Thiorhodovibrio frisius]EIC21798.1 sodium--glutamate symport carrier GltS [Thiorhodovibrio frisius]WPL21768.1 Glutamate permease [Thiorhodovibrio frisius]